MQIETSASTPLRLSLQKRIAELYPGGAIMEIRPLRDDEGTTGHGARKAIGYGEPALVRVAVNGDERRFVLHTARAGDFGHDRRADRAGEMLLAYDTFGQIPRHVPAIDIGYVDGGGDLVSIREAREFYLLTEWAGGTLYADDLRRIVRDQGITAMDRLRCERLASYLAELHAPHSERPEIYRRAIRDVIGHGEGIFGLVDAFPAAVPGAALERLYTLERKASAWRQRLRGREDRLAIVHGDFHPFNLLFTEDSELQLLDAARGCRGDPADDAVCIALNYLFFALDDPAAWDLGLRELWRRFWEVYIRLTNDHELFEVAPLYMAWRSLVMVHPRWYPSMTAPARDALLSFVDRTLDAGVLVPERADEVFS